jgi:hypothetical protein
MDDEAAQFEREYQEKQARERAEAERLIGTVIGGKYRIDAFEYWRIWGVRNDQSSHVPENGLGLHLSFVATF